MKSPTMLALSLSLLSLVLSGTDGAVGNTNCCNCISMMPDNVPLNAKPQIMPSPFKIIVREQSYSPGDSIHVSLVTTDVETFRSFMLVAYTEDSKNDQRRYARGQFILETENYETKNDCFNDDGTGRSSAILTNDRNGPQLRVLKFIWKPTTYYGHIEFRATFVQNDEKFWVREKSRVLYDSSREIPPEAKKYIRPINTAGCGKTKGCFREPEGCSEPQCLYILTWTSNAQSIDFELGGLTDGSSDSYVAAAFSDDADVGGDSMIVCAHNSDYDTTEVYLGKMDGYESKVVPKYMKERKDDGTWIKTNNNYDLVINREEGTHEYNRLQCRFTMSRSLGGINLKSLARDPYHVLMFRGIADDGEPKPIGAGHDEFPFVSKDKIQFAEYDNSDGRMSYPLVKAHGCLMIIAWVLFSSVGFLLAKYYQPMWPENRMFERKYWFTGHFQCMAMVIILVVISIILIFVEVGGYSKVEDLPYEAHPILGIIILICVLLLPIIGLLRPGPGHNCRTCANWMYWIFATIANVLAIPNIFIGMDFGKASVPWWATWILVIWVIFHIVVEITLEVHQCMTHKKNKERRKKHELLKRDYPKQHHPRPDPAGRRFKSFMLSLHLAITILIVVIMVIIIAVS